MSRKLTFACLSVFVTGCFVSAQKGTVVSANEFKNWVGCWNGTQNYNGTIIRKPFSTNARLVVKQLTDPHSFQFLHIYTKDPHENVADTITVSKDGRKLNGGAIKSKRLTKEGMLEIVTEFAGFDKDYNKTAIVRQTFWVSKNDYRFKKQVQLQGEADWLDREEFDFIKAPCEEIR
jgi:hypothetical protein